MSEIAAASFRALGTTATLFTTGPDHLPASLHLLREELVAIDRSCSRFRADSELSRVNSAKGRPQRVSELFIDSLEAALRAARATDGLVDPTVGRAIRVLGYDRDFDAMRPAQSRPPARTVIPGWRAVTVDRANRRVRLPPGIELDLGATAKAFAADRAARQIEATLGAGVLVNLGGDIAVAGEVPAGRWRVRVTDDHSDHAALGETIGIAVGGLATSSTTVRRWRTGGLEAHHIVDPRRGSSAAVVWRTASVAAASCVDANTASTAAIIRGDEAPGWLNGLRLPSRLVHRDGRVLRVGGWPEGSG